jgi:pantoate--beta-alanine ligase
MIMFDGVVPLKALVRAWRLDGLSIGLVPTMGYLHEGHASLIRRSVEENDRTVVSIFVNPTQFGPSEDFESYPRDFAKDEALCRSLDASVIFHPELSSMYPPTFATKVEVPSLSEGLCGRSRPAHFGGVCAVVLKLFNLSSPDRAYFGLKDAQQYFILSRMVEDLNLDVTLVPCPIVRDEDGVALSSRNSYLSKREREAATVLSRALFLARGLLLNGERDAKAVTALAANAVASEPLAELEYAELVDVRTLKPVDRVEGEILLALAARFGKTRLIDNIVFNPA